MKRGTKMKKIWVVILFAVLACWAIPAMAAEGPANDGNSNDRPLTTSESSADDEEAESHTLTFYSDYHEKGVIATLEVAEDETIWDAINKLKGGQKAFFKKIDPEVADGDQRFSVEKYCFDEALENGVFPQEDFAKPLLEDTTYYAKWATCIMEADITVTPPACGTKVNTEKDSELGFWNFKSQKEHPVITLPDNALYEQLLCGYISGMGDTEPIALNGVTLEGGKSYQLFVNLQTNRDYCFSEQCKFTVNGAQFKSVDNSFNWAQIVAEVTAEHVWGDWKQTKAPTCSAEGEEARACTVEGCKAEEARAVAIDPNAHEWGEWKVTKKATTSAEGEKQRVCKHNSKHVETEAIPKLASASSGSSPKTGDALAGPMGIALVLVAASGICVLVTLRRKINR